MATPADEASNDNEGPIHSVSYRSKIKRAFGRISVKFLSLMLFVWSGSLMARRPVPPPIAAMDSPTHHTPITITNSGRRRCIGQFLASYNTRIDTEDETLKETKRDGPILHWINENTSCDLPSEPSSTTWNWKKKDINKNGSKISTDNDEEEDPYHVVMLLMDNQQIHHEVVALSAGFLVAGLEVTIFYIFKDDGTAETQEHLIKSEIFQRLPPYDDILQRAQESFRFVGMNLNDYVSKQKDDNELNVCMYKAAASHPLDKCSIAMAPAVLKMLINETRLHTHPAVRSKSNALQSDFVLMMDASFLGGLLFSEIKMIPSIVIGSHQSLMFAVEQEPNWNPSPNRKTLDRMDMVFLQRIYSLGLTGVFLQANKLRHSLGMKRLQTPLDQFLPVVAILTDLVPSDIVPPFSTDGSFPNSYDHAGSSELYSAKDDERGFGYRVHNFQPLLSPCSLCFDEKSSTKIETNASIILVVPPAGVSAQWTRSLIRAFSMTKQSLEGYDECLFDRATCRNGVAGFEVNWLSKSWEKNDPFPPVVPSYIHRETSESLLDSAIRNPSTMIALIHCDSEASILASFGVEVFCISQSNRIPIIDLVDDILYEKRYEYGSNVIDSASKLLRESLSRESINPEEIATQLLTVLRRKSVESEASVDEVDSIEKRTGEVATWVTSGMQRAVTIVQSAARLHREIRWKNPRQMQRVTSSAITKALHLIDREEDRQQVKSNWQDFGMRQDIDAIFTVFLACSVFLAASIFIILKDSVAMKRWRHHRQHQYYRNGGTIFGSFINRLDDLEKAWDMFLSWSSEFYYAKPTVDAHGIGRSRSNENVGNNARKEQHSQHNNNPHQGQMRRRRKTKTTR